VRQSAFAVVGELSKKSMAVLRPCLREFLPVLADNLQPEYHSACNNACWALGEVALRLGGEIEPLADVVLPRLIRVINGTYISRCLVENAAITLGRLGLAVPHKVAPHLQDFLKPWCLALSAVRDDAEKESAFRGMCLMIQANPQPVLKHFSSLVEAIASWTQPSLELKQMFHHILHSFKVSLGPEVWQNITQPWPQGLKVFLAEQYQL
jgi:hypothetical protein